MTCVLFPLKMEKVHVLEKCLYLKKFLLLLENYIQQLFVLTQAVTI